MRLPTRRFRLGRAFGFHSLIVYGILISLAEIAAASAGYIRQPIAGVNLGYRPRQFRRRGQSIRDHEDCPALLTSAMSSIPSAQSGSREAVLASTTTARTTTSGPPKVSYSDLSPISRVIAGVVEISLSTLLEFMSGFTGGYILGCVFDVPRLLTQPVEPPGRLMQQITGRAGRMHSKSFGWAKQWGGISAAFGGFRVATKVIRGGVEDEWNTIFSSMAAGAYFARKEGPNGMIRGAVMYGGLMYLLSGKMFASKEPFEYDEQPIDF